MRVLILHNRYRQYGGEDAVAEAETDLLRSRGVEVLRLDAHNEADPRVDLKGALRLALNSHWSSESYRGVREICRKFRPDVAHVHNFWMRLSPAVHAAFRDTGLPTVQTLHNFRLFCTNAQFQRSGHQCEDCLGRVPWRGVVRRCYRHSFLASAAVARMIITNRARGTWQEQVNAFIALSAAVVHRGWYPGGTNPHQTELHRGPGTLAHTSLTHHRISVRRTLVGRKRGCHVALGLGGEQSPRAGTLARSWRWSRTRAAGATGGPSWHRRSCLVCRATASLGGTVFTKSGKGCTHALSIPRMLSTDACRGDERRASHHRVNRRRAR